MSEHYWTETLHGIKLKLKTFRPVASVTYSVEETDCSICRNLLTGPSTYKNNNGELDSSVSIGNCSHVFHTQCISNLINSSSVKTINCPTCRLPWSFKKKAIGRLNKSLFKTQNHDN